MISMSFFDGFNVAHPQVPAPNVASAITLTVPAPVVLGGATGKTRTRIKYVENPADEALLMATGVLLVRNRQLKRKLKEATKHDKPRL